MVEYSPIQDELSYTVDGYYGSKTQTVETLGTMISSIRRRFSGYHGRMERYTIAKNVAILGIIFVLNFTAYASMQNLQSSINLADGLGTASLTTIYVVMVATVLFLPSLALQVLGCKWTIALGILPYAVYMLANCYPTWATIIPSSALIGLGGGLIWPAKCQMLTQLARRYADLTGQPSEVVIKRFFALFFMAFQSALIWGSLMVAFILQTIPEGESIYNPITQEQLQYCGASWCYGHTPSMNNTNLAPPDPVKRYVLCGTFFCLCSLAFITAAVLLETMKSGHSNSNSEKNSSLNCVLALATFKHLRDGRQILLIPITLYSGLEQGFFSSEFTRSYVSCALGIWVVGLAVLAYAIANTLSCLILSISVHHIDRTYLFLTAALLQLASLVTMFLWHPDPQQMYVFFILAVMWGVADAIWNSQINALYGCIFHKQTDAAFSNYRLWETIGFIISFTYSDLICVDIKIFILIGVLTLGMVAYYLVERIQSKRS